MKVPSIGIVDAKVGSVMRMANARLVGVMRIVRILPSLIAAWVRAIVLKMFVSPVLRLLVRPAIRYVLIRDVKIVWQARIIRRELVMNVCKTATALRVQMASMCVILTR